MSALISTIRRTKSVEVTYFLKLTFPAVVDATVPVVCMPTLQHASSIALTNMHAFMLAPPASPVCAISSTVYLMPYLYLLTMLGILTKTKIIEGLCYFGVIHKCHISLFIHFFISFKS
jgi:hypothetical protein